MSENIAEILRILQNMIAIGTIVDVDHANARAKVSINDGEPGRWIPIPGSVGKNYRGTNHLRNGTQVLVGSPSGDPANGVILQVFYSDALPSVSTDGAIDMVQWNDGTTVTYNTSNKRLELHSSGDLVVSADGAIGIQCLGDLWLDAAHIHAQEGGI
ncbi:MAG: phage baseplate assembly protein V [Thalassospira sp.]|jgi:phage baseplate assembly protein V|uniref:phage baseplate assembly protein V n=1 Tax=Thalassospira sp. 11-3 TaxID=2135614 RepID=UPI000D773986|nr:phage baseplate assembly protein V [Thalassospira sp. 11-3]MBL4839924.1 phage baseplate assembly protein V [Thalassospira sp.]PXX30867.1 phage baseplate assembly protein V [Thalassospira sp. 11-3]